MTQEYINQLIAWANAGNRSVDIKIQRGEPIKAWCWDSDMVIGEYVTPPTLPNLDDKATERERAEYERLKAKYDN